MVDFRLLISIFSLFTLLVSCARYPGPPPLNLEDSSIQLSVADSILEEGYNASQRALANYILTLPPEEQKKWISGSFTKQELNSFIDTLQKKPR